MVVTTASVLTPNEWLRSLLDTNDISRARLARMIGRSREEVQRWVSGREQIPRVHLAEIVSQVANDRELDHVLRLKDCEDLNDRLGRLLDRLAKKLGTDPPLLRSGVRAQLDRISRPDRGVGGTRAATHYVRHLADAIFAFRTVLDSLTKAEFTLFEMETLARHLRYPQNHYVGLMMEIPRLLPEHNGVAQMIRETMLQSARSTAFGVADPSWGLLKHHALHMLARHGEETDRDSVNEYLDSTVTVPDVLAKKLGYSGLIMSGHNTDEVAQEYVYFLARNQELARVDLTFDATHYGDATTSRQGHLPDNVVSYTRLSSNIVRHFFSPDIYGPIVDVDSFRLLSIIDLDGGQSLVESGADRYLADLLEHSYLRGQSGSFQALLRKRLGALLASVDAGVERAGGVFMRRANPEEASTGNFDVFLAHNSCDHELVTRVASILTERRYTVWLDKWELVPGQLVQDQIEAALPNCRTVAVFIGHGGVGPWESVEIRVSIQQAVYRLIPVIPVLITDIPPRTLPPFLGQFKAVETCGRVDPTVIANELARGIEAAQHRSPTS